MIAQYQHLLTTLAEDVGLEASALLATEEVVIDGLTIGMQLADEGEQAEVLLCSLLGPVSADRWPEVARSLLLATHLWTGTGGATLGVMDDENTVSLNVRRPLHGLDAHQLSQWLAQTADIGLAWQDYLSQPHEMPPSIAWPDAEAGLRV